MQTFIKYFVVFSCVLLGYAYDYSNSTLANNIVLELNKHPPYYMIANLHWLPPKAQDNYDNLINDYFFYSKYDHKMEVYEILRNLTNDELKAFPEPPDSYPYYYLNSSLKHTFKDLIRNSSWMHEAPLLIFEAIRTSVVFDPLLIPFTAPSLPKDISEKLKSIRSLINIEDSLKRELMDAILVSVIHDITLPLPLGVSSLPQDLKQQIYNVIYDFSDNFDKRRTRYQEILEDLPVWQRLLMDRLRIRNFNNTYLWSDDLIDWGTDLYKPPAPVEFQFALGIHTYKELNNLLAVRSGNRNYLLEMDRLFEEMDFMKVSLAKKYQRHDEKVQEYFKTILNDRKLIGSAELEQNKNELLDDTNLYVFPSSPPDEYKAILPSDRWQALLNIHQNSSLPYRAKVKAKNHLLNSMPTETRLKYPLPIFLQQLPKDKQLGLKNIYINVSLPHHQKLRSLRDYLLTFDKIDLIMMGLPCGSEMMPEKIRYELYWMLEKHDVKDYFPGLSLDHMSNTLEDDIKEVLKKLPIELYQKIAKLQPKNIEEYYPNFEGYPFNIRFEVEE